MADLADPVPAAEAEVKDVEAPVDNPEEKLIKEVEDDMDQVDNFLKEVQEDHDQEQKGTSSDAEEVVEAVEETKEAKEPKADPAISTPVAPVSEEQKKLLRAQRFGLPVTTAESKPAPAVEEKVAAAPEKNDEAEKAKLIARAARFGLETEQREEIMSDEKVKARIERWGKVEITEPSPKRARKAVPAAADAGEKKADSAEPKTPVLSAAEKERIEKRQERFGKVEVQEGTPTPRFKRRRGRPNRRGPGRARRGLRGRGRK